MTRTEKERQFRRKLLAEAAAALFLESPYHSVTVDDITARAGFSKGSFYKYFYNKDELVFTILYDETETLNMKLATLTDPGRRPVLPGLCALLVEFHHRTVHLLFTAGHLLKTASEGEDFIAARLFRSFEEKITGALARKSELVKDALAICLEGGEVSLCDPGAAALLLDSAAKGLCLGGFPSTAPEDAVAMLLSFYRK